MTHSFPTRRSSGLVAERIGVLDRPFGIGEISARAADAGFGIELAEIVEQLRDRARGHGVAVDDDRGNIDRAVRDDQNLSVRQRDDQVGTRHADVIDRRARGQDDASARVGNERSEEHTSELQSLMRISYAVFCLKKKNNEQRQMYSRQ